jgi:hypothetical protein
MSQTKTPISRITTPWSIRMPFESSLTSIAICIVAIILVPVIILKAFTSLGWRLPEDGPPEHAKRLDEVTNQQKD